MSQAKKQPRLKARKPAKPPLRDDRLDASYIRKHIDKLWEHVSTNNERLQNLEIQVNLMSRLMASLALERMKMRLSELRRMIRKIEKEAIAESEIQHLESLYRLDQPSKSKS